MAEKTKLENENKIKMLIESSLKSAMSCTLNKNYGRAFAHYLLVLKLDDTFKLSLKTDFTYVMREWTEELERQNRVEDLFKCYEQACDVFPECETVLNNIGAQLFRLGYIDEGALYIRKALRLAPGYVAAHQNLENICGYLVDRWHFRMLNDTVRNEAFHRAIKESVHGNTTILDIGAGTGLLSLYCVEAGFKKVYACEKSKTMHDVAKDVLNKNGVDKQISLICKNSTELKIPSDIPERVDVLVTETFDAGLFGEHILSTLNHALTNLCTLEKKPCVIPTKATVYVCAVESQTILNKNRFLYPFLQNLDLHDINIVCKTTLTDDEPYTTEDLSIIRDGYAELSAPYPLLNIDFSDISQIENLLNGISFKENVVITRTGRLDAIVLWFDLHLNEDISISTRPDTSNCWEQAIYPVLPQHFTSEGGTVHLDVQQGGEIVLDCKIENNQLKVKCCKIKESEPIKPSQTMEYFKLDHAEIQALNDINTNRIFFQALERLRLARNVKNLSILDVSHGLSPLSLQAAILGYSDVCVACDEEKRDYVKRLCEVNDLSDKVRMISRDEVTCSDERYDVITSDVIEPCGVLKQQILEEIALLRVTSLRDHGVILPEQIKVYGVCIDSNELLRVSRVIDDQHTSGYHIAEFINDFQSTSHVDIDFHTLQHTKLSSAFLMFDFSLNLDRTENRPASFLEQQNTITVNILESGTFTAILYWFEFIILDELKLSSLDYTSRWKQAAIMMKSDLCVNEGEKLLLKFNLENSCIELKSFEKS